MQQNYELEKVHTLLLAITKKKKKSLKDEEQNTGTCEWRGTATEHCVGKMSGLEWGGGEKNTKKLGGSKLFLSEAAFLSKQEIVTPQYKLM